MMTIEQLRATFQAQLDAWQAAAQAFEVQINLGKREALDRLEQQKRTFTTALEHMKQEAQRSRGLLEAQRQSLAGAFDHLKVQLGLGRTETKELFDAQEKSVRDAIARLDAELNRHVTALTDEIGDQYVRWSNALKAEFEAASGHFESTRAHQQAVWDANRKAFEENLATYKQQLAQAQSQALAQAQQLQGHLASGMEQLKQSFGKLFSSSREGGGSA